MTESMTNAEVLDLVQRELSEIMEIDPEVITEGAAFVADLNADSLALIELVEALEAALKDRVPGFRIDDDDLESLVTVADAVTYIARRTQV